VEIRYCVRSKVFCVHLLNRWLWRKAFDHARGTLADVEDQIQPSVPPPGIIYPLVMYYCYFLII